MNREFKSALDKRRILSFPDGPQLIVKEIEAATQDLEEAADRLHSGKFKYATITAYYAMFHAARALLFAKQYREKSHHFLSVAIEALYVETGLLPPVLARALRNAMILREEADYHGQFSREGAEVSVQQAGDFLRTAGEILGVAIRLP